MISINSVEILTNLTSKTKEDVVAEGGDFISMPDFVADCEDNNFIDYDGFGELVARGRVVEGWVYPSDIVKAVEDGYRDLLSELYNGVIWYNR